MSGEIDWARIGALVADGVQLAAGDRVSVFTTDSSVMAAVSAFVEEGWRRGAVVQVLATDERFDASALRHAPTEVLEQAMPLEAAAMQWSDVHVSFRAMTSPVVQAPPERIAALRHGRGLVSTMRWESTRWALVRVPTPQWAEAMGLDGETLVREWGASFDADWADAGRRMQALCDRLDQARRVVVEDAHGRLELTTAGRTWVPFSGSANWPDGEVATAPVETQVEGSIRFPGALSFGGVMVRDLELDFEKGHVVAERAAEGVAFVRDLLDGDEGARRVGELGIGTNAALTTMTGDLLIDEKILGTMHIALGRAYPQCGGVNSSALHWDIVKDLRGVRGSLRFDDTWLVKDGVVQDLLREASVGTAG
ncbi:aminopeptidase [Isoptericola sp. b441]|uniref:Aminopeptidase n=1 Tax=Actinotalea lenta TaxID=3064654 RepID=A0ABT9DDB3_9CELL|nr:aminopeptidase [Isoptericola sp. b441]MDO8108354.1 aminopeptidase [Isoptericola sp. b441]